MNIVFYMKGNLKFSPWLKWTHHKHFFPEQVAKDPEPFSSEPCGTMYSCVWTVNAKYTTIEHDCKHEGTE